MHIGAIIENIILIRDKYRDTLTSDEEKSLADACNILDNRFNRFDTSDILINQHITSIHWMDEDIRIALEEKGFSTSEENISKVCNYLGLEKYLQEKGIEAGWDVIYNIISELKDELEE